MDRDEIIHLIYFLIDKGYLKFVSDTNKNLDDLIDEFEELDGGV